MLQNRVEQIVVLILLPGSRACHYCRQLYAKPNPLRGTGTASLVHRDWMKMRHIDWKGMLRYENSDGGGGSYKFDWGSGS